MKHRTLLTNFLALLFAVTAQSLSAQTLLIKGAKLIDGNGGQPLQGTDILVRNGRIESIGKNITAAGADVVDAKGKTVMPAMISAHVHVGVIKGNAGSGTFFTRENVLSQLRKYTDYGVTNILTMGTDRPLLFESGLRDSSLSGLLPGARYHSAGYGFNVPDASVTPDAFLGRLYRPSSATEVSGMMAELIKVKPEVVKIWVDGTPQSKMKPEIFQQIINEAHKNKIRVAAHVYYAADADRLIDAGLDIFGHSIRDTIVGDALVQKIKSKGIPYIPTLTLDRFASAYTNRPGWMDDPYFRTALEPGVFEMLDSEKYREDQRKSAAAARSANALKNALINVKKLHDAGVLVALGTDSGAFPIRPQGFTEHLELELLVQAGISPLAAITIATKNAAKVLKIDNQFGTIEKGKTADFVILNSDPSADIRNTRTINAVYKNGVLVSNGPIL